LLGNEALHSLTSAFRYKLLIHLKDFDGNTRLVKYNTFYVADEMSNYRLTIADITHDSGKTFIYWLYKIYIYIYI